jgi:phosphate transport system permease protein
MTLATRKAADRSFTAIGVMSIVLMGLALIVILAPIVVRGAGAVVFRATVEHRRLQRDLFGRGNREMVAAEVTRSREAARPVWDALAAFVAKDLGNASGRRKRELRDEYKALQESLRRLLGPLPGDDIPVLPRHQYGQPRWDRAQILLRNVLFKEVWETRFDEQGTPLPSVHTLTPRAKAFADTAAEPIFTYLEQHLRDILRPRLTCYLGFFTQEGRDAHFFGGIWPEILGTLYLTLGAILFAIPVGILSAIFLVEYTAEMGRTARALVGVVRTCISTLAGVPSIVFGLFGLAFFIHAIRVSENKSVLAGALTLGVLVLPTVIRSAEEAIKAVPQTYKEAAMSLGAGRWHTIVTVVLPAALPGIITGIVISMGRAAGETAPIIFTAAVSVGRPLPPASVFSEPTPALSWNIYNLCTEHEAVEAIRHVQFGMVMTLVVLVLLLNLAAILIRARVSRKLKG